MYFSPLNSCTRQNVQLSGKEILGQIPRLFFGGVKSFVGKIPVGNPGGANVPPLKPFPIEEELQDIFRKAGVGVS